MEKYSVTEKTKITRLAKRGSYDRETINAILDESLVCTLAFVRDNQPFQIPTGFCRIDNKLYVHGSVGSTYMRGLAEGNLPVCISVTIVDGLVLARSAFHHSMNYRSAVIFSHAERVTERDELYKALEAFTNKVQPGRWNDVRHPSEGEWKSTMLISLTIEEASAKIRTGPPSDDDEDYALDIWAGVVPLEVVRKTPLSDPALKTGISPPSYLTI